MPYIISILFVTLIVTVIYGLFRSFSKTWEMHRLKIANLKKLEKNPDSKELHEMHLLLKRGEFRKGLADYRITGIALAAIGALSGLAGRHIGTGSLAVGLYIGGAICVWLGLLLAIAGILKHRKCDESTDIMQNEPSE